jgi:hypothetical protein
MHMYVTLYATPVKENKYVKILNKIICDRNTPMSSLKLIKNLQRKLKKHGSAECRHFWEGIGSRTPGMQEIIGRCQQKRTLQELVEKHSSPTAPKAPVKFKRKKQKTNKINIKRKLILPDDLSKPPPESYNGFKASDGAPRCFLSNLYGGAEFEYMAARFEQKGSMRVARLLRHLGSINFDDNYELFQNYRHRLQNKKSSDAYRKGGKVAAGLLATLINGCWRQSMKRRLKAVNDLADELKIDGEPMTREDFLIEDDAALAEEKKKWMMQAHKIKFSKPFYNTLLRNAHDGWLFERKNGSRDANSNWAGKDGWLAEALCKTKQSISQ